jgi:hypothetical protein
MIEKAIVVHSSMIQHGFTPDVHSFNLLLTTSIVDKVWFATATHALASQSKQNKTTQNKA